MMIPMSSLVHKCVFQALVFRPLRFIAQLDQELAVELHPKAHQAVNEIELSRGTGTDISLRYLLFTTIM
jgi:hypothetical protein